MSDLIPKRRAGNGFLLEHEGCRVVLDLGYSTLPRLFELIRSSEGIRLPHQHQRDDRVGRCDRGQKDLSTCTDALLTLLARRWVMKTTARTLRDIALRATALIGFYLGMSWIVGLFPDSGGANIGAGPILFVAIMVLSGLGGLYDGWRVGFFRMAIIWAATSILVAVGMIALFDPLLPFDADVFCRTCATWVLSWSD